MSQVKTYQTTKDLIISTPIPEDTRTYKSISNQQLIDLTLEGIATSGFELDKEFYSSAREGNVAMGKYTIKGIEDNEMQLQILWRNSYNKISPVSFGVSSIIKVCSNGMIKPYGLSSFKKRHSGEVQTFTPRAISEYIKNAQGVFEEMQQERERMKQIELTRTIQAELCGKMFVEHEFIKSTQLNIIKRELDAPTHDYGDINSLWSMFNYTTFAMREIHPSLYLQDHIDAYNFFTQQAGIIQSTSKEILIEPYSPFKQLDLFEELYQ